VKKKKLRFNDPYTHRYETENVVTSQLQFDRGFSYRRYSVVRCIYFFSVSYNLPNVPITQQQQQQQQVKRLLAARSCWIDCISLDPETQEDGVCLVRPDEGLDSISQVDESVPAGFLWKAWIHMLASNEYVPEKTMFAHPYDWRLPPELLEERDRSFSRLKYRIELVVREQEEDQNILDPGITLVALSLGNLYVQYFFKYLETELGKRGMERWVEKHVYSLVMAGAPYVFFSRLIILLSLISHTYIHY